MMIRPPIKPILIAPCGMNCTICHAYLRDKNKCLGCRIFDENKSVYCQKCIIANCEVIKTNKSKFCYECDKFPCKKLKSLDKRYANKYHMSMLENLENIKVSGIDEFIKNEEIRWTCKSCGSLICVHKNSCLNCGEPWCDEDQ